MENILGGRPAGQGIDRLPVELAVFRSDLDDGVEELDQLLIGAEAERPEEDRGQEFLFRSSRTYKMFLTSYSNSTQAPRYGMILAMK